MRAKTRDRVLVVLRDARNRINNPDRWTAGRFARDDTGNATDARFDNAVKWCALGTLICSANCLELGDGNPWPLGLQHWNDNSLSPDRDFGVAVTNSLKDTLHEMGYQASELEVAIARMNDCEGHGRVIEFYDRVIDKLTEHGKLSLLWLTVKSKLCY